MKTIRRNAHRKITAIALTIVKVEVYDQVTGGLVNITGETTAASAVATALSYLKDTDYAKLYDNGDGKYTIHVHSNLWYYLYTQAHLDMVAANQAAREVWKNAAREARNAQAAREEARDAEQRQAWRPMHVRDRRDNITYVVEGVSASAVWLSDPADATRHVQWVTIGEFRKHFEAICENGNNHMVETCPGCGTEDENGNQVEESTPAVTVTRTRMAIGEQISQACEALGIELGHGWSKGAAHYEVQGKIYTAGELADLVLEGGFAGNYGGNEVRVNWDCPLVFARTQERRAGRALMITRELQARMGTATARELEEVAVSLMDMLHEWAIEAAPRPKADYPSGAAEPDASVQAVQCVRTGEVWRRHDGKTWTTGEGALARWSIWYCMNEIDPMSEGFNIYRKES